MLILLLLKSWISYFWNRRKSCTSLTAIFSRNISGPGRKKNRNSLDFDLHNRKKQSLTFFTVTMFWLNVKGNYATAHFWIVMQTDWPL